LITEERENRALRDINVSKKCSYTEVSEPAIESMSSFRMLSSDNKVEKISTPPGKLEEKDGFTIQGSCLRGREDSFVSRTDSVIDVDDDYVPETNTSGIRDWNTNIEEKGDNSMVKDIKFNIRKDPTSSVSPYSNGTFVVHHEFKFLSVVVD